MRTNLDELKAFLEKEYSIKTHKNSSYSKNAFARDLGIPQTTLKDFLNGKRDLSFKNLNSIFKYLNSDIHCSFCDKHRTKVRKMIAGPRKIYICDECIDKCFEITEKNLRISPQNN